MAAEEQASQLIKSGAIHAGQDALEAVRLCRPARVEFVDRYAFVMFYPPGRYYHGLTLIAVDGKLASAHRVGCQGSEALFETIRHEDRMAASNAYESRVYGVPTAGSSD